MNSPDDKILDDVVGPGDRTDMTPEHRSWINDKVKERLARLNAGEMGLKSMREVRRKLGFDADSASGDSERTRYS